VWLHPLPWEEGQAMFSSDTARSDLAPFPDSSGHRHQ
jgi:hypothetical protein